MLKFGFGSRFKHRSFDYIPRYYDPVKEELKERLSQYRDGTTDSTDPDIIKERIKSGLRMKYRGDIGMKNQETKKSNYRLFSIIVILFILTYLIIQSDKFIAILEAFTNNIH